MNTNDIMTFCNGEFGQMRAVTIDDEPWFMGKDAAQLLGYSKPLDAIARHVDEDDSVKHGLIDSMGRQQTAVFINESGLYSLILSSKLPGAKRFKHWVTSEILPAIRRHGVYAIDKVLENPDLLINALLSYKAEREKRMALETKTAEQAKQITEMQPKVTYYDIVLNCKDVVPVNAIAKDYGQSAKWLNQWLRDHKIQYRQGKLWHLYQKYADKGYTKTKTLPIPAASNENRVCIHTYWTQKGRLFIYEQLKGHGILPLIEQRHD